MPGSLWRMALADYNGLRMGCAPGTHEAACEMVFHDVRSRAGVLDCGARTGALLARLRDSGFRDLHAVDLDLTKYGLSDIPIHKYDLNSDFSRHFDRTFSLVTASEVIEHLDSPRHFLTEVHHLLADDGFVLITLPNIAFWAGRIKFLLKGEHWGFSESHWRTVRHISPLTYDQMKCTLEETGFKLLRHTTAGSFDGPLRKLAVAPFATLFRVIAGPRALGECDLYLAKKIPVDPTIRAPKCYSGSWAATSIDTRTTSDIATTA